MSSLCCDAAYLYRAFLHV